VLQRKADKEQVEVQLLLVLAIVVEMVARGTILGLMEVVELEDRMVMAVMAVMVLTITLVLVEEETVAGGTGRLLTITVVWSAATII
jgi:hypothetical protein